MARSFGDLLTGEDDGAKRKIRAARQSAVTIFAKSHDGGQPGLPDLGSACFQLWRPEALRAFFRAFSLRRLRTHVELLGDVHDPAPSVAAELSIRPDHLGEHAAAFFVIGEAAGHPRRSFPNVTR